MKRKIIYEAHNVDVFVNDNNELWLEDHKEGEMLADFKIIDEEDEFKEMRAYRIGFDLGYYRAYESINNTLGNLLDNAFHSATFNQMLEESGSSMPIFMSEIMSIRQELNDMRNERLPLLLAERKEINRISTNIAKIKPEDWERIDKATIQFIGKLDSGERKEAESERG